MQKILCPLAAFCLSASLAGCSTVLAPPGQPRRKGVLNSFELVGDSLVSAQQVCYLRTHYPVQHVLRRRLEAQSTVTLHGHLVCHFYVARLIRLTTGIEWTLGTDSQRPMDTITNSFCAGGNVLGNGTWVNAGGNQAVTYGGNAASSQTGRGPYRDPDGRNSIRLLDPCQDGKCNWILSQNQIDQRWYPTLETLEDGSIIILGGCKLGGYVNDAKQNNPTYEFFPPNGPPITSKILSTTLPANLFPLVWLLPSGRLILQSNWATSLLNYTSNEETPLDDMPDAVRVYPASAGTVMLPLRAANNWTATILFCGGSNVQPKRWTSPSFIVPRHSASTSCVTLTPDISNSYTQDDPLPEPRTMVNLIFLPTGKIFAVNGARMGTAGYGNTSWAIGQSYADDPVLTPAIYDPSAPTGRRWSQGKDGLKASTVPRMYHSSAILLSDGSVMISGSNPNSDYNVGPKIRYPTEYRTELFYPSYYNERRPEPKGLISQFSYGGPAFDVQLDSDDLFGNVSNVQNTQVVILRTGFSTHALNMGQRYLELEHSYTGYDNNTATLHVRQLPRNPAIFAPGPAFIFVVVNGIPSVGLQVMVGSGKLGKQEILPDASLPDSTIVQVMSGSANLSSGALEIYSLDYWVLCTGMVLLGGFIVR